MMPTAPGSTATEAAAPADLVARFAAALARLLPERGRIGLAVSGGPDSMAMLLLAEAAAPGQFEVAAVDHGLRPEAAAECALVETACAERNIACTVLKAKVGEGNLQAQARKARYAALAEWAVERGLAALATAHHADDQAETLLMRLNRGSGVAGLAGVREASWLEDHEGIRLIRPVLYFRRAELAQVVQAAGINPVDDPSNQDESFGRVRIRRALAQSDWLDALALAQSAGHLAEAEEVLECVTSMFWKTNATCEPDCIVFRCEGWRAIHLRIIERAITRLGSPPRGQDVARLLNRLEAGQGGNIAGVLVTTDDAAGQGRRWIFRPEPPRRA